MADSSAVVVRTPLPFTYAVRDTAFGTAHRLTNGDTLWVAPGRSVYTFLHPTHFDLSVQVDLARGEVVEIPVRPAPIPSVNFWRHSSYFRVINRGNLVINTDHDTRIRIEGRDYGSGSQVLNLPSGLIYRIVLVPAIGKPKRHRVDLFTHRFDILEEYERPTRLGTAAMGPLIGLAQLHKGQELKGAVLLSVGALTIFMTGRHFGDMVEHRNSWERNRDLAANFPVGATRTSYLEKAAASYSSYRNSMLLRDRWFGIMAGVSAISFMDALFPPEGGFRSRSNRIRPILTGQGEVGLRVRVD